MEIVITKSASGWCKYIKIVDENTTLDLGSASPERCKELAAKLQEAANELLEE